MKRRTLLIASSLCAAAAGAQTGDFPSRDITLVVPFPAGGGVDLLARTLAPRLQALLGRPVVVDNRAGATGIIGTDFVARAAPDGHTLVIGTPGPMSIGAAAARKLPYDPLKDFAAVSGGVTLTPILVVNANGPIKTVADLIQIGKSGTKELAYASGGVGNSQHLAGEMFKQAAGIRALHVAYKGTAPALTDVIGGQVDFFFSDPSALPLVQSGRLRAIAVSTAARSAVLPDVPTVAESGLPGFVYFNWYSFFAPAATPPAVVDRLHKAIAAAITEPEVAARLRAAGMEPDVTTPKQLQAALHKDYTQWRQTITKGNLKLDE